MASCELCGQQTDSTTLVKIEGAKMKVCDSCKDLGTQVNAPKKKTRRRQKKKLRPRESKVLVSDYGQRVKEAREDKTLSMKEVAESLNEKHSVLSKVEKQELKPDKALAQKLEKKFGIKLYTTPEAMDYDTGNNPDGRSATLGDVAKVKED